MTGPIASGDGSLPAWSEPFAADHRAGLERLAPLGRLDRDWAFGDGRGAGVTVAVVDSGVEGGHPAIGGALRRERPGRARRRGRDGRRRRCGRRRRPRDGVAPGSSTPSRRTPTSCRSGCSGPTTGARAPRSRPASSGRSTRAPASSTSACRRGARRCSASSTTSPTGPTSPACLLVCAANNVAVASYPSLFAAVVSVAAHDVRDPGVWFYNPQPPVEFGAYGLDVDVAWKGGGRIVATGNSFAAPHIAGYAARIRATHPGASPFEVKTILAATADAATEPTTDRPAR